MSPTHPAHRRAAAVGLALAVVLTFAARPAGAVDLPETPIGLSRLLAVYAGSPADLRGVATFDAVPTAAQVAGLEALGLTVQPMKHVPLALVLGTPLAMETAVGGRHRCLPR